MKGSSCARSFLPIGSLGSRISTYAAPIIALGWDLQWWSGRPVPATRSPGRGSGTLEVVRLEPDLGLTRGPTFTVSALP
jgi:hypothetical protein